MVTSESTQFWWNWWVQLGVSLGTIAAALVALFGAAWRAKFFPPILRLALLRPDGEKTPVRLDPPSATGAPSRMEDARFFHLSVKNERRWSPAHEVQVFLTRIESPGSDGSMTIEWLGSLPMRWRHQEVFPLTRVVGPTAECDLLGVVKGKFVELHALIAPYNLQTRRPSPTHFIATFEARSSEANSPPLRIEVHWDGAWHDGDREMKRHFSIRESLGDPASIGL